VSYQQKFDLTGRAGIVTGGAGILGSVFTAALLEAGAAVAVADVDGKAADKLAASLKAKYGKRVVGIQCDVSDGASVHAMVAAAANALGPIRFLLNNAATSVVDPQRFFAPFETYDLAEWRRVMSINLDGMFLVAQAVGKHMLSHGLGGSIVHTSSIYGTMASDPRIYEGSSYKGYAINNPAVYAASKAGVIGLTRWLATYWAEKNIRVNALAPGGVHDTENETFVRNYSRRVPMGRMAQRDEMAGAVLYLISDASSYVTGQTLLVDGGLSAW
jgi:NAD(P)-dependent dehydrogenase (short-subunit alcohol dehydrogenase family)